MGYSRERLTGMTFTDFKTKSLIKYLKDTGDSCVTVLTTKRPLKFESKFETSSGVHSLLQSCQPFLDEKGDVKYIYNMYTDISKIEKNRDYLSREIEEFIKVYDQMADWRSHRQPPGKTPEDPDLQDTFNFLTKLRTSVRGIIANLQVNIRDVNNRMLNLTTSTETTSHSVSDAVKGVQVIAQDASKVSSNAEKASQGVDQIAKAMQDMSAAVEEITSSMESVSTLTKQTNDLSQSGAALAGKAEKGMAESLLTQERCMRSSLTWRSRWARSPRSSCLSANWPIRQTCWRSMQPLKQLVPGMQDEALPSSRQK